MRRLHRGQTRPNTPEDIKEDTEAMKLFTAWICFLKILVILFLFPGCASYSHTRQTPDGPETTSVNTLFMKGEASKVSSYVKDGAYSRRVGVGEIGGAGDSAFMQALIEAGMAAGAREARQND